MRRFGLALSLALAIILVVPPLALAPVAQDGGRNVWNLPADFSSVQGQDNWYYYRVSSGSYVPLVWDPYVNGLGHVGDCWSPQVGPYDDPRYFFIKQ